MPNIILSERNEKIPKKESVRNNIFKELASYVDNLMARVNFIIKERMIKAKEARKQEVK